MIIIDPTIIEGCIRGERRAQHTLYQACYVPLMKVCRQYTTDDQEAAAYLNEGFLKVFTHLEKWKGEGAFYAWAKRIVINTIIDGFRKSRKYKEMVHLKEDQDMKAFDVRVDLNWADQHMDAESLLVVVRRLPEMSAKVFNLFASEGMDYREIGGLLGIHENTAKWHVFQARKKLKEWIHPSTVKQEVTNG
ncbi:MAG: sigma-70 family RNA polymerase sigma factor [Saprospiraceae bacterium]|jgi:RNA polymerase sigma factor (sigma-70 family)|nr:sigma-70 family RNA polymerase sigma factor [Saprospiraceae bacterium]